MKHFLISAAAVMAVISPVWAQSPYPAPYQPQPQFGVGPYAVPGQPQYAAAPYAVPGQPQPPIAAAPYAAPGRPQLQIAAVPYTVPGQPQPAPAANADPYRWRSVAVTPEDAYREGLLNRWELQQLAGPLPQALQGPSADGIKGGNGGTAGGFP